MADGPHEPPRQVPHGGDIRLQVERVGDGPEEEAAVDAGARPERRADCLPAQSPGSLPVGQQEGGRDV